MVVRVIGEGFSEILRGKRQLAEFEISQPDEGAATAQSPTWIEGFGRAFRLGDEELLGGQQGVERLAVCGVVFRGVETSCS